MTAECEACPIPRCRGCSNAWILEMRRRQSRELRHLTGFWAIVLLLVLLAAVLGVEAAHYLVFWRLTFG